VFLSVIGGKNYTLLCNLLAPQKLSERTLADLADALKKHFRPNRIVIAERFRFHCHKQAARETVADYEAELRRLAFTANLENTWTKHFGTGWYAD